MRTPEDVRALLDERWRRSWTQWLSGGGTWPMRVPLQSPLEREARANWPCFVHWMEAWRVYRGPGRVEEVTRTWTQLGVQTMPAHLEFATAHEVACAVGQHAATAFERARGRQHRILQRWPSLAPALDRDIAMLATLDDLDFERFTSALGWLIENPDSGTYVRQLPIAGMDSKWVERHAGPLARLVAAHRGRPPGRLEDVAGLGSAPLLRRMRLLDPALRRRLGGLSDITVPLDELARLDLPVQIALIVENQQTALACEDLPGAVVLMGGGFAARALAQIPWLSRVPVLYWGDIDQAGFQILSALRQGLPHAQSCLMDEATLIAHRDLWSTDILTPAVDLPGLTDPEQRLVADLRANRFGASVRLEQERLRWPDAWAQIQARACDAGVDSGSTHAGSIG